MFEKNGILEGREEDDSVEKPASKNLVTLSLAMFLHLLFNFILTGRVPSGPSLIKDCTVYTVCKCRSVNVRAFFIGVLVYFGLLLRPVGKKSTRNVKLCSIIVG
jgi:hypothetical protein